MIHIGDCKEELAKMPDQSVNCVVTSPPYFGLRSYLPANHPDKAKEIGLEGDLQAYIHNLVAVFREARRVLRDDGTLWLNLGDSYASATKGSGGTGKSGRMRDGRREEMRIAGGDRTNQRAKFDEPVRIDIASSGLKPKDLIGVPWRVALALQADGWYLRDAIVWAKGTSGDKRQGSVMPSSVKDRFCSAYEMVFLLSKKPKYHFDLEAVKEKMVTPGAEKNTGDWSNDDRRGGTKNEGHENATYTGGVRNRAPGYFGSATGATPRNVWLIGTKPFKEAHFAVFPPALAGTCIRAGCPEGGTVLDPFFGAGTVGLVAESLGRKWVGIELNEEYAELAERRILRQELHTRGYE